MKAYIRGRQSLYRSLPKSYRKKHPLDFESLKVYLKDGNPTADEWFRFQSFTTAVITDQCIRTRIKAALAGNIRRGEGYKSFEATVRDTLKKNGLTKVKNHQIKTIYRTNQALAFAAGQQAQLREVADDFPLWQYIAVKDSRTRDSHRALDGKIFKSTDNRYYPPIGFNCRCTARPLTRRQGVRATQRLNAYVPPTQGPTKGQDPTKAPSMIQNAQFVGQDNNAYARWADKAIKKDFSKTELQQLAKQTTLINRYVPSSLAKPLISYLDKLIKNKTSIERYDALDAKKWQKVAKYPSSGGWVALDKRRIAQGGKSDTERRTLAKELKSSKVFAQHGGMTIKLVDEIKGKPFYDAKINGGIPAELKSVVSYKKIVRRANYSIQKKGAKIMLFEFEKPTKLIYRQLGKLRDRGVKGYYYFKSQPKKVYRF